MADKPELREIVNPDAIGNEDVIRHLKEVLAQAEAGFMTGVCVTVVYADGYSDSAYAGRYWTSTMVGALDMAKDKVKDRDLE